MDETSLRQRRASVKAATNIDFANATIVTKASKGVRVPIARTANAEQEIAAAAVLPAFHPMQHYARIPRGMIGAHMGGDYPGHYAVVDPQNLEIEDGAVVLMRGYDERSRPTFAKVEWSVSWKCWVVTAGFRRPGRMHLSDTVKIDYLRKQIMGRAVGVLAENGEPLRELWPRYEYQVPEAVTDGVIDPETLPDVYCSQLAGDCLDPVLKDGDMVGFRCGVAVERGDLIGIWLKPHLVTRAVKHQALIKVLVTGLTKRVQASLPLPDNMDIPPLMFVQTLNPLRTYIVPLDQLAAVVKCTGRFTGKTHKAKAVPHDGQHAVAAGRERG